MSHDELEERMMISQMKGIFTMQPLLKGIWFDEIWKHSIKKKNIYCTVRSSCGSNDALFFRSILNLLDFEFEASEISRKRTRK